MPNRIDVGFSSETLEFRSRFPELHMPAYPVGNPAFLQNPNGNALAILDGEPVFLDNDGKIQKITAGIIASNSQRRFYLSHGQSGRADTQMAQSLPIVMDDNFEIATRLIDQTDLSLYVPGTAVKAGVITDASPGGLYPANAIGFVPADPEDEFLATVVRVESNQHNGAWIRLYMSRGVLPA